MSTHRKVIAPMIAAIIVMLVSASATVPPSAGAAAPVERLPGSWDVVITTKAQGSFPGLFTFTSDGALIGSESPGPFESATHGNWIRRGNEVAFTIHGLIGTGAGPGQNAAKLKVVGTLHFNPNTGGWDGPFRIEVYTGSGPSTVVLFEDCGEAQLTRIDVEKFDCDECRDRSVCS